MSVLRLFVVCAVCIVSVVVNHVSAEHHYTNEWAVEILGGEPHAQRIAKRYGYEVVKSIPNFDNHYILRRNDVPHRSKRSSSHHTRRLVQDEQVNWAEQQVARSRVKREVDLKVRDDGTVSFNDPQFRNQWYIHGDGSDARPTRQSEGPLDLHIEDVWRMHITGRGVVVTVLDDGIEHNNTDLALNYDPYASGDLNDDDPDPMPRYDVTNENKHGTRCAGEIAMVANNGICGVGVAFNSRIGGVRMLDGKVTDSLEAQALSFNLSHVDIFSASWGPNDDGVTVEGPGHMASKALEMGIKKGRGGKGVIYAWASGNGGRLGDNCNCDGYTSSPYTLSVSSASEHGEVPWYGEKCASTFATTYSSGNGGDHQVISADLHDQCTTRHTGTSAAAPMAAGIFALLLEANPDLTWRDVQHLVAWTSKIGPLKNNDGWIQNAAGLCVNPAFGFGLLNAKELVLMASPQSWVNVAEQHLCTVTADGLSNLPQALTSGNYAEVIIQTDGCQGQDNEVNYLEHVQLELTMTYSKRGAISVTLVSPSGTETTLMNERDYDKSSAGFKQWPLMSVHTWGENPRGAWRLRVFDKDASRDEKGQVTSVTLKMYGTKDIPNHMKNGPHKCDYSVPKSSGTQGSQPAAAERERGKTPTTRTSNFFNSMMQEHMNSPQNHDYGHGARDGLESRLDFMF